MPTVTFRLKGSFKTAFGVIEDCNGNLTFFGFDQNTHSEEVDGGGLAWLTFSATGDPGDSLTIEVTGQSGNPACESHTYKFPQGGKFSWPFQFNPNA